MRALNQCAQCAHSVSESVVPMAVVAGDVAVFGRVERIGVIAPRSTSPCGFRESVIHTAHNSPGSGFTPMGRALLVLTCD